MLSILKSSQKFFGSFRGKAVTGSFLGVGLGYQFIDQKAFSTSSNSNEKGVVQEDKVYDELTTNHFNYGVYMVPHPDKIAKGGEDAFWCNENYLIVADGVGGWADAGVDPALYSRALCKNLKTRIQTDYDVFGKQPKKLLISAANDTREQGSSTIAVLELDKEELKLRSAYIGDCGYIILRKEEGKLTRIFQSDEQQRRFNFPYQVGFQSDPPHIANEYIHEIKNNDIVVVGSDGLFDNIDDQQIIGILEPFLQVGDKINDFQLVTEMVGEAAYKYSLTSDYQSPFAKKAKLHYYIYNGGKSDDITVAIGQINIPERDQEGDAKSQ